MPHIHLLARAVIEVEEHILLAQYFEEGTPYAFLPGGHVESGESVVSALARELHEELGRQCVVREYLGAIEHAWESGDQRQQELNHLFRVDLHEVRSLITIASMEPHLTFRWQHKSRLHVADLRPHPLVRLLRDGGPRPWWASTLLGNQLVAERRSRRGFL